MAIWMKSNLKLSFPRYQSLSVCLEMKTTVTKMGQSDENKLHYCELLPDYRIKLWNFYTHVRNHFVSITAIFRFCHLRWLLYVQTWGRDRWLLWFYIPRSDVMWTEKNWYAFRVKLPFSNSSSVMWTKFKSGRLLFNEKLHRWTSKPAARTKKNFCAYLSRLN